MRQEELARVEQSRSEPRVIWWISALELRSTLQTPYSTGHNSVVQKDAPFGVGGLNDVRRGGLFSLDL